MNQEVSELIEQNSSHAELETKWYLPAMVVAEGRYQMELVGKELITSVGRVEKFLGRSLEIDALTVKGRVQEAIESDLARLGVVVVAVDAGKVEWSRITEDSVSRNPPFEPGTEKGFRDAIIGETFLQFLDTQVEKVGVRIVLVTADALLQEFVKARLKGRPDVDLISSAKELARVINARVSRVSKGYVAELEPIARLAFFELGNKDTLFYQLGVRDKLQGDYSEAFSVLPPHLAS
jgi:PIN domain